MNKTYNAKDIPVPFWKLFRFSSRKELAMNLIGVVFAIAAGAGTPFMSLFFGNLINSFVQIGRSNKTTQDLENVAQGFRSKAAEDSLHLTFLGLGLFISTFMFISLWSYTGEMTTRRIREHYFKAILHQDLSFFDHITAGEVATRVEINAHLVQQGISEKFAFVMSYTSSFVTGLSIAFFRSWRLALALIAMVPCILLVGAFIAIVGMRYSNQSLHSLSKAGGVAQESLSTIRIVHAFGSQRKILKLFDSFILTSREYDIKFTRVVGIGMAVFSFIVYSSYSLSFYFGTTLLLKGLADAGTIVTVGLSILIGSFSLAIVGPHVEAIVSAQQAASHLYNIIDRSPAIMSLGKDGSEPTNVVGDIEFQSLYFSYPSRKDSVILRNLNIRFPARKTSAIVGFSGSGKSTIISLIERFYDAQEGSVFLDGLDVRNLNVKWLRSQIGLVSQDPILFTSTIFENVSMGLIGSRHEHSTLEEKRKLVANACIKAQAHGFIESFPNGYDTMVGGMGARLSGGQKQRIAIARAIVADPPILLLDEATSALDTHSEGVVQAALKEASQGRTTVVVAHRLSTIKDADVIFVMGNGQVLEYGTHEDLMNTVYGHYAELVKAQRLDGDNGDLERNSQLQQTSRDRREGDIAYLPKSQGDEFDMKIGSSEISLTDNLRLKQTSEIRRLGLYSLVREIARLIPDTFLAYLWGTIFGCLGGLVHPAFGVVYARALHAFESSDIHSIRIEVTRNALWLFLIAIISMMSLAFHNYLYGKAAIILVARLRSLSFGALLKRDVAFFDQDINNPGSLTANLIGRPEKIKGFATMTLGAVLQCTSCCLGGSIIGLIFGWKMALVGIACMPAIVLMGFARLQIVANQEKIIKESHNLSAQIASEAVAAVKTVASLTCENYYCNIYSQTLQNPLNGTTFAMMKSSAAYACSLSIFLFTVALVFWYGSRLVASGEYTTFQFYVTFMTTVFGSWNAANVFMSVPDMTSATDAARDILIFLLKSEETEKKDTDESMFLEKIFTGRIEFRNIFFHYPSRPDVRVLNGFNLVVEPGSYVAFVGPSGSGKSTVIQLLERYYEPSSGGIYLDGMNVSQINVDKYRASISLVSQDTRLYSGTIRFNILLGSNCTSDDDVTEDELHYACRVANILDFIVSLPMGFETLVGEGGSQLSGGQKQRIAIARALLRNPKVLLLDEATSALDANAEAAVQTALNDAAVGRTTIAIAHRLSSIQHADCIYFIQGGHIRESGTHSQLLAQRGFYYRYAQDQQLNE